MACEIAINDVFGVTIGGILDHIIVVGTALNCDQVNLTISCSTRKTVGAKVSAGVWAAKIPAAETGCECGSTITISGECISGQCRIEPASYTLLCQEQSNCPLVSAKAPKIGDCNKDGTRSVTFFYQIYPQGVPVGASLLVDGVPKDSSAPSISTYVLSYSTTLSPGPHVVTYIFDPKNCGGQNYSFDVDPCPLPGGCPKIEFDDPVFESECRDGSRSVRITAKIEPQGAPTDAKLVGAGGTILQAMTGQVAPFKLSGVANFSSGSTTVSVVVDAPAGCPGKTQTVSVDCGETPRPRPPNNDDDGGGDGWCFFGRVAIVLLFAAALFLLLVGLCLVLPWALIAAAVAAIVAALAFALWWAFCGSKCAALLIGWQILAVGAAVAAFLSGCCLPSIFIAIGLALGALAGFFGWIQVCRPSACKSLFELLWVFITPVPLILKPLSAIAPCGLPAVPTWIGVAAAALALLWGVLCAKKV